MLDCSWLPNKNNFSRVRESEDELDRFKSTHNGGNLVKIILYISMLMEINLKKGVNNTVEKGGS